MKKKLIVFMFSFIVTVPVWAAKPSLEQISAETLENGSPYGDSVRVMFDQPMKNYNGPKKSGHQKSRSLC
jgi:hypothetical protein